MQTTFSTRRDAESAGWLTPNGSARHLRDGLEIRDATVGGYGYTFSVFDRGTNEPLLQSTTIMLNDEKNLLGQRGCAAERFNVRDLRRLRPSKQAQQRHFDDQVRKCCLEMQRLLQSANARGLDVRSDIKEALAREFKGGTL